MNPKNYFFFLSIVLLYTILDATQPAIIIEPTLAQYLDPKDLEFLSQEKNWREYTDLFKYDENLSEKGKQCCAYAYRAQHEEALARVQRLKINHPEQQLVLLLGCVMLSVVKKEVTSDAIRFKDLYPNALFVGS